ncbi:MAG: hypothetical protein HKL90_12745 [Elusimicrobia bacterium]|nr:hypothetical protein [Elusimicrobiota bacterium]
MARRLLIDTPSYLRGMESIAHAGDFLRLQDVYHSPGYQIYLGFFRLLIGRTDRTLVAVRLAAWLLGALCVAMVFRIGEKRFERGSGALAAVILTYSRPWRVYAGLIQYEVPLGFLLLLGVWLLVERPRPPRRWVWGAGFSAAAAAMIQLRMLPWSFLAAAVSRRARRATWAGLLAPSVLIVGGWSWYQSHRLGRTVVVADVLPGLFERGNNPNALGYAFPYRPVLEPSGLRFVAARPARFVWLVSQRFLYLWDIKRDIWSLEPSLSSGLASSSLVWTGLLFSSEASPSSCAWTFGRMRSRRPRRSTRLWPPASRAPCLSTEAPATSFRSCRSCRFSKPTRRFVSSGGCGLGCPL